MRAIIGRKEMSRILLPVPTSNLDFDLSHEKNMTETVISATKEELREDLIGGDVHAGSQRFRIKHVYYNSTRTVQ